MKTKPQTINATAFGMTHPTSRKQAADFLRVLRKAGFRLVRDRVRSAVGITAWDGNVGFVAVSYKVTP